MKFDNENKKTTNDGRNKNTTSRKNQNAQRKGILQIFGNIGSGHHQTCEHERECKKKNTARERGNYIAECSLKG